MCAEFSVIPVAFEMSTSKPQSEKSVLRIITMGVDPWSPVPFECVEYNQKLGGECQPSPWRYFSVRKSAQGVRI